MRKALLAFTVGSALVLGLARGPALATSPVPGPSFGRHAASMAPEHPLEHGRADFGLCVSAMASGETCPHSH